MREAAALRQSSRKWNDLSDQQPYVVVALISCGARMTAMTVTGIEIESMMDKYSKPGFKFINVPKISNERDGCFLTGREYLKVL